MMISHRHIVSLLAITILMAATFASSSSSSSPSPTRLKRISHIKVPGRPIAAAIWGGNTTTSSGGVPLVAVGTEGGRILLFETPAHRNATQVLELKGHTHVNSLSFSTDGTRLISGSTTDEIAIVWNLQRDDGNDDGDGDDAASGGDKKNKKTIGSSKKLPFHSEVYEVAFDDELFAVGDGEGKLLLFSRKGKKAGSGGGNKMQQQLSGAHKNLIGAARIGSESFVRQLTFFNDTDRPGHKKVLAVSGDFRMFVFDAETGRADEEGTRGFDRTRKCRCARFSPDGKTLCCGEQNRGTVYCEALAADEQQPSWESPARGIHHGDHVFNVDFLSDDLVLSVGSDRSIQITSRSAGPSVMPKKIATKGDNAVVSADKRFVAGFSMFNNVVEVFAVTDEPARKGAAADEGEEDFEEIEGDL